MSATASLFAEPTGPLNPWAIFSPCLRYRYVLAWPTGLDDHRYALFILANPSTATAEETDPTVARCIAYAKRWGYGWCRVVNVRAWRETDPKKVPAGPIAVGPDNFRHVLEQAERAAIVVCGWGNLGGDAEVAGTSVVGMLLRDLRGYGVTPHALKLNKNDAPAHPLYLKASAMPFPMRST
jgi:hypothetical protein